MKMKTFTFLGILVLGILGICALPASADDWPMFMHDPQHTGFSTSKLPDEPFVLWRYETVGGITSSPLVSNGKVFAGSLDTNLYCLNEDTGELLWSFRTMGPIHHIAASDERVFICSEKDKIYALDHNGELLWSYFVQMKEGIIPHVTVSDNILFVASGEKLLALSEDDGDLIWMHKTHSSGMYSDSGYFYEYIFAHPAVFNGRVFFGTTYGNVYCLNESTGKVIWLRKLSDQPDNIRGISVGYEKVFVTTGSGKVYALNMNTGGTIWNYKVYNRITSCPAVHNGRIFVGSHDGNLYCLDESTGRVIWKFYIGYYEGVYSPAIADDKVIFGASDKNLYVLDEDSGKLIWKYRIGGEGLGDGIVRSSPAIANGKIFVATKKGRVYALTNPIFSSIKISSIPESASVYLDSEYKGKTPLTINTTAEYHTIRIVKSGYKEWEGEVKVSEGIDNLMIELQKIEVTVPTTGNVSISTKPSNAGVYLDNEYKGTSPLTIEKVSPGDHQIKITKKGYRDWVKNIIVRAGKTYSVDAELQPISGFLIVDSEPPRASVFLDGEYMGVTPQKLYVSVGRHNLEVSKQGYMTWSREVEIKKGQRVRIIARLISREGNLLTEVFMAVLIFSLIIALVFLLWKKLKS